MMIAMTCNLRIGPVIIGSLGTTRTTMVRRWNKNRRHQRDDDASSAAAETAQAEAVARCDPEYSGTAGQPCKTDSYADLCGL